MSLNNLKPAAGSTHHEKRIGRGQGSGHGGTSTRGHKGAQSRSGYHSKLGFEGGQMPLQRRLPKFGFTNIKRVEYKAINLNVVEELAAKNNLTEVNMDTFVQAGFVSTSDKVKVLGNGTLTKALTVTAHAFSKSAQAAIEAQGGKAVVFGAEEIAE
ncbi:MAG: 50S ribosomal protein L15 [Tidjanibacter sp.]|nr:50S ribosomal protein L15 [Tidjanibacter sp.]MBQ6605312.1 50S ribosomal protein L15 [Tidjanibacter sp.]